MRRIALLAVLLLAYGCGSPPKPVETKPTAGGCCSRYSDFTFEPLPLGKEVKLTVSETSPVFAFAGGASHYVALRMPEQSDKGTFIVRSHPERSVRAVVPWYFFPAVTFLDERHGELATLSDERFAFLPTVSAASRRSSRRFPCPPAPVMPLSTRRETRSAPSPGAEARADGFGHGIASPAGSIAAALAAHPTSGG